MGLKRVGAHATVLHSVGHSECRRVSSIVCGLRHQASVELTHHLSEPLGTAEYLRDFSQSIAIHRVEGFRQIHGGKIEVGPSLLALLLDLASSSFHVGDCAASPGSTLTFPEKPLFQVNPEAVEENGGKDLPGNNEQQHSSVIVKDLAVLFPLEEDVSGYFKFWCVTIVWCFHIHGFRTPES
nr:unnamed protein product [Spirometra erinaceieuropaei]